MHSFSIFVAVGALFTAVSAVPMKRDVEIDTVTQIDTVVEMVTATVWVDATDSVAPASSTAPAVTSVAAYVAPTPSSSSSSSSAPAAAAYVPPQPQAPAHQGPPPSFSSSEYVAPPPSSTSQWVAPTTSSTSQWVAPSTSSTSQWVAPVTSQWVAPTTSTWAAPAATSSPPAGGSGSSGPSNGQKYSGADLTFYNPAGGFGSCGWILQDSDKAVAIAVGMMDKATMCGKQITLTYGGNTTTATIADTCMGCQGTSIDVTEGIFKDHFPGIDGRAHNAEWWYSS